MRIKIVLCCILSIMVVVSCDKVISYSDGDDRRWVDIYKDNQYNVYISFPKGHNFDEDNDVLIMKLVITYTPISSDKKDSFSVIYKRLNIRLIDPYNSLVLPKAILGEGVQSRYIEKVEKQMQNKVFNDHHQSIWFKYAPLPKNVKFCLIIDGEININNKKIVVNKRIQLKRHEKKVLFTCD